MSRSDYDDEVVPGAVDARFTLAAERTVLAWLRTALGLIAAGVVVLHLVDASSGFTGRVPLGVFLLAMGAFTAIVGTVRWLEIRRALHEGGPLPGPWPILALTALFVAAAVAFAVWT